MNERTLDERSSVIRAFHYLCRRGARKFWRPGLDRSDLEQVAAIGLIKACDRYDPASRTPFEAYAWLLIVGELMHHVRDHEHAVRMPRRLQALEKECARVEESLVSVLGREVRDIEVAAASGVTPQSLAKVRRAREATRCSARIDDPEEAERLASAIPISSRISLEDQVLLRAAVAELPESESVVVLGIYALGMTRAELAARLGATPRAISRLHRFALKRLEIAFLEALPQAVPSRRST